MLLLQKKKMQSFFIIIIIIIIIILPFNLKLYSILNKTSSKVSCDPLNLRYVTIWN